MTNSQSHRRNTLVAALRLLFLSVLLITAITASARADLVVTIYSGTDRGDTVSAEGVGSDKVIPYTTVADPTQTVPYSAVLSAVDYASSASTTVSLTSSSFDYQFNDTISPGYGPNAYHNGIVVFSVSQDTAYSFAGAYQSTVEGTYLATTLSDITPGIYAFLFSSVNQASYGPASLTVGPGAPYPFLCAFYRLAHRGAIGGPHIRIRIFRISRHRGYHAN